MASTISTPSTYNKPGVFSTSSSLLLHPQTTNFHLSPSIPQLGHGLLSPWNGLKHVGLPIKQKFVTIERRRRRKCNVVRASLFGVGAPEALVIGVVALLVFGPKGLAEVARNLGQTLRAFQPTIKELQDVSRDFKSTLEREIGLDDVPPSTPNTTRRTPPTAASFTSSNDDNSQSTLDPNGNPLTNRPYSTEEYLKTTEEQLKAMAAQQQATTREPENQSQDQDVAPPTQKPFNLGEVLVEAQKKSTLAKPEEQAPPQEPQSELKPQSKEATPTVTPPKTPESEK